MAEETHLSLNDEHDYGQLQEQEPERQPWYRGPLLIICGLVLSLLVITMVIPPFSIRLNPEPTHIASFDEAIRITSQDIAIAAQNVKDRASEINTFLEPNNPKVKQLADRIATLSGCPDDNTCYAKAAFYFVRNNVRYVNDPPDEYIKPFDEIIVSQAGDCDDHAVLLANLLQAIGIPTKFVFVPNHVYVQAYLPESLKKYQDRSQQGWVSLDATCKDCGFGELAPEIIGQTRRFV